jgi:outer membrane protein
MKQLLVLSLILGSFVAHAAEIKIGYVDMQMAIQQTSDGKKAKKNLEGIAKGKEDKLKKLEAELKVKGDDFKKKASIYDEATKRKKQMELQKEFYDLQQLLGQSQQELRQKEEEALKPIVSIIREQIDAIAKKDNYTIVLEKSENLVLFAKKEIDLTDAVVKAYERVKK